MNYLLTLLAFPVTIFALRGIDEYVRDSYKWYRMRVRKSITRCEDCNGHGYLKYIKLKESDKK